MTGRILRPHGRVAHDHGPLDAAGRRSHPGRRASRPAGYRTGIFGKWHLGDNYPFRPQDRGFEEVLVHGGGGVGQTPDYWGNDYFDDTYFHNGKPEKQTGYCTDVWFDEAMRVHRGQQKDGKPFFATSRPTPRTGRTCRREVRSDMYQGKPGVPNAALLRHDHQHRREHGPAMASSREAWTGREHDPDLHDRQRHALGRVTARVQRRDAGQQGQRVRRRPSRACFIRWPGGKTRRRTRRRHAHGPHRPAAHADATCAAVERPRSPARRHEPGPRCWKAKSRSGPDRALVVDSQRIEFMPGSGATVRV